MFPTKVVVFLFHFIIPVIIHVQYSHSEQVELYSINGTFQKSRPFSKILENMKSKLIGFNMQLTNQNRTAVVSDFEKILDSPNSATIEELNSTHPTNIFKEFYPQIIYLNEVSKRLYHQVSTRRNSSRTVWDQVTDKSSDYRRTLSNLMNCFVKSHTSPSFLNATLRYQKLEEFRSWGCSSTKSTQMIITRIYNLVMTVFLENYAVISLAYRYKLLELDKNTLINPVTDLKEAREDLAELLTRLIAIEEEKEIILERAPTSLRRCDPPIHQKHITYEKLTHFIEGWVGNEKFLRPDHKCGAGCSINDIRISKSINSPKTEDYEKPMLSGRLYDCQKAPEFDKRPPQQKKSVEKLDPGQHQSTPLKTSDHVNHKKSFIPISLDGRSPEFSWPQQSNCQRCFCHIDRELEPNSIRKISTAAVTLPPGVAATGVRWILRNNTIHLELQGHVIINNGILTSSKKWYSASENDTSVVYLNFTHRSIYFDDVRMLQDRVVVGAKLISIDGMICLIVAGAKLQSGSVITESTMWFPLDSIKARQKFRMVLVDPDASEYAPSKEYSNTEWSAPGFHYIQFQPSDLLKDNAQSTVPYFDIQEVVTDPPTPLQKLGIYYKAAYGFGGFIGLKVFTAKISIWRNISERIMDLDKSMELYVPLKSN